MESVEGTMTQGELEVLFRERIASIQRTLRRSRNDSRRIERFLQESEERAARRRRTLREAGVLK